MSKPKPATVGELIATVNAYLTAQAQVNQHADLLAGKPNPLVDELYLCAVDAAKALRPLVRVELATVQSPMSKVQSLTGK